MKRVSRKPRTWRGKRIFDCLLCFLLVLPVLVISGILAVLVRLKMGAGPVLFRQRRIGLDGKAFQLIKFRTMTEERGPNGERMPDQLRLNSFGRWLRSTSLDELPEIWNILRGEMSWVGPRPLLPHYLDWYTPEESVRHTVLPGITGWAQVNGRNALDWDSKLALDAWYARNASLWLDLRILLLTGMKVLSREGISAAGEATAEDFALWRSRNQR